MSRPSHAGAVLVLGAVVCEEPSGADQPAGVHGRHPPCHRRRDHHVPRLHVGRVQDVGRMQDVGR